MATIRESEIETALTRRVNGLTGAKCVKFVSPGLSGVPDRLILLRGGVAAFAEVKAPGLRPRPLQNAVHKMLRRLGFKVFVVDGPAGIEQVCKYCRDVLGGEER